MVKNNGVSPSGPGHSAEPGPICVVPADTASVPNAWRPIETAPKDGRYVDLWGAERERYASSRITDCTFRNGQWWHSPTIYDDEEWVEKNGGWSPVYNVELWMPLPEPPERCEGCDQIIPWHAHPCPALKAGMASAIKARGAVTTGAVRESATEGDAQTGGSNG